MDYVGRLASPLALRCRTISPVRPSNRNFRKFFDEHRFDIAICDFLDAAVNFPGHLSTISVLFQHNVETEIWRRHATTESNPVKRRMYGIEFKKMHALREPGGATVFSMLSQFRNTTAASWRAWVEGSRITVVPTGVDLDQYKPDFEHQAGFARSDVRGRDGLGAEHRCHGIFLSPGLACGGGDEPRTQGCASSAEIPARGCVALSAPSIEITGRVPSVAEHLRDACGRNRSVADRRRYSPENLRSHGGRQSSGFNFRRAPRAWMCIMAATSCLRTIRTRSPMQSRFFCRMKFSAVNMNVRQQNWLHITIGQ